MDVLSRKYIIYFTLIIFLGGFYSYLLLTKETNTINKDLIVRVITTQPESDKERETISDFMLDPKISGKYQFILIDSNNKNYAVQKKRYKVTGSMAVVVTNREGDVVHHRFGKMPTKQELIDLKF